MNVGKIKWFDEEQGFGMIETPQSEEDVFVHYSVIQKKGFKTLKEGQTVRFQIMSTILGPRAINVTTAF